METHHRKKQKRKAKQGRTTAPYPFVFRLKKEHPEYGIRRITDVLKRFFWVKISPATVQRNLRDQGLSTPAKKKPKGILPSRASSKPISITLKS